MIHLFVYLVNTFYNIFVDKISFFMYHVHAEEGGETMTGSNAVKTVLSIIGKSQTEMAEDFGISKQTLNNKFGRNTWTLKDLQRLATIAGCKLLYRFDDGTEVVLSNPPDN